MWVPPLLHDVAWKAMGWHGLPREQGPAIKGLKQGVEPCPTQMVKITAGKREGGERPTGPSSDATKERKAVFQRVDFSAHQGFPCLV